jgi:hypothetical protein
MQFELFEEALGKTTKWILIKSKPPKLLRRRPRIKPGAGGQILTSSAHDLTVGMKTG